MAPHPTILYIEDNHDNQRLVARVLEARGYQVVLADSGPAGIAIAAKTRLDLVLVDINIPTLDGFETTTRLRGMDHLRTTPIVALTADVQAGTRERSLAAGCDGYISKPIEPRQLAQQLQEFIAGKRETLPGDQERAILREYTQKLVRRLEQQVQEVSAANDELQQLDQLKSRFIATVSHELRTPLTAIVGYVELFERGTLGALAPAQHEALQVIERNAHLLADQLNSLIYLQEVRASQLKRTPFLVHEVLRRVISDMQHAADEARVTLRTQIEPTALISGDASGIEHALRQIVDNAIKFTPEGGQALVVVRDEPRRVIIRVRDSGVGIPAEANEHIFEPFYQIDNNLARGRVGVGIGLAIVKHVIDAHNGQVLVRSNAGQGSQFTVVLPRE